MAERRATSIVVVSPWEYQEVVRRPPLGVYLQQLWQRRYFIWADAQAKAFSTSRGTILGRIWLALRPFLDAFIYFIIFGVLLGARKGIENYPAYLVTGINLFALLSSGLAGGAMIVPGAKSLIRAFSFPRFALVLSWAIRSLLDFLPVLAATILFALLMPPGVGLHWHALFLVPLIAIGWLIMLGMAAVTAAFTEQIPDLKFIWPILGRLWFYSSGVFFAIENLVTDRVLLAILTANPGHIFISMARQMLIYHTLPPLAQWLQMLVWAMIVLATGLLLFWRKEISYGRE